MNNWGNGGTESVPGFLENGRVNMPLNSSDDILVQFPVSFAASTNESASAIPPATYKPSVFYFRHQLGTSQTCERAKTVALIVANELEQLKLWSAEQGLLLEPGIAAAAALMRLAIKDATSHMQAVILGFFLCHELEQLKALVRAHGMIPPKWIVAPEEAEEKGWTEVGDEAVDF